MTQFSIIRKLRIKFFFSQIKIHIETNLEKKMINYISLVKKNVYEKLLTKCWWFKARGIEIDRLAYWEFYQESVVSFRQKQPILMNDILIFSTVGSVQLFFSITLTLISSHIWNCRPKFIFTIDSVKHERITKWIIGRREKRVPYNNTKMIIMMI